MSHDCFNDTTYLCRSVHQSWVCIHQNICTQWLPQCQHTSVDKGCGPHTCHLTLQPYTYLWHIHRHTLWHWFYCCNITSKPETAIYNWVALGALQNWTDTDLWHWKPCSRAEAIVQTWGSLPELIKRSRILRFHER